MKPKALLLPLAAIIAAAFLLVSQSRAISSVREKTAVLSKQIAASRQHSSSGPDSETSRQDRTTSRGSINWLRIAELTGEGNNGIFAKQELLRAKRRIQLMSPAELLTALDATRSLGIDSSSLGDIEKMLITSLGEKDPEAAAEWLTSPSHEPGGPRNLINVMNGWSKKDLPSALAWFDRKISSGSFASKSLDGQEVTRLHIESTLLGPLTASDSKAAAQRLLAYSAEDRAAILSGSAIISQYPGQEIDETASVSRVLLARETLPADAQASIISFSVEPFSRGGDYGKLDHFLENVAATPSERATSVATTARLRFQSLFQNDKLTVAEVDRFREWASTQSPNRVDELTASGLAMMFGNGTDPAAKAAELALHYQESSGRDDILIALLRGPFSGNRDKAYELAERIKDPEIRAEVLKRYEPQPPP